MLALGEQGFDRGDEADCLVDDKVRTWTIGAKADHLLHIAISRELEPRGGEQFVLTRVMRRRQCSADRFQHVDGRIAAALGNAALDDDMAVQNAAHRIGNRLVMVAALRSEEHTSELQSLMRISYAVFCLKK